MALTPKQERFCQEYIIDLNATQAYIRTGYARNGAEANSARLIANDKVAARIKELQAERGNKLQVTQERVLQEYARLAFLDPRKLFDENDNLRPIVDLDDDTAAAVSGLDVVVERGEDRDNLSLTKKIKLVDKKGALDSICRLQGFNAAERYEHSGPNGGPIPIAALPPEEAYRVLLDADT